jgi:hypothetical protein
MDLASLRSRELLREISWLRASGAGAFFAKGSIEFVDLCSELQIDLCDAIPRVPRGQSNRDKPPLIAPPRVVLLAFKKRRCSMHKFCCLQERVEHEILDELLMCEWIFSWKSVLPSLPPRLSQER